MHQPPPAKADPPPVKTIQEPVRPNRPAPVSEQVQKAEPLAKKSPFPSSAAPAPKADPPKASDQAASQQPAGQPPVYLRPVRDQTPSTWGAFGIIECERNERAIILTFRGSRGSFRCGAGILIGFPLAVALTVSHGTSETFGVSLREESDENGFHSQPRSAEPFLPALHVGPWQDQ